MNYFEPYTHQAHAAECRKAAERQEVLHQYVQVKLAGLTWCARIRSAWVTRTDDQMWSVDLCSGDRASVRVDRVRQCSNMDGLCICAQEADAVALATPQAAQGPAFRLEA